MAGDFEEYLRMIRQSQMEILTTNISSSSSSSSSSANGHQNQSNETSYPDHDGNGGIDDLAMQDFLPEELPASLRNIFTVFYIVIMLLAVTGNATTILVIAVNREMRTVTNIFLLSLAISDALIAVINMPVQLVFYLQNGWTMGEAMCKFSPYLQGVVIVTSILTLTALALDRYYAICHPLRARHVHTISRAVILSSVIWVLALLLLIPQLFIQRLEPRLVIDGQSMQMVYVCVEFFSNQHLAVLYTTVFYIVLYIFPVLTMFATYGTIATRLWRRRPIGESTDAQRESDRRLREKQRIVRMLVIIVVMFAVSWFPFFTVQLYLLFDDDTQRLQQQQHSFRVAIAFFQLLGYSNSCVNPIVYCFMNDSFQKNFFRTLRCRRMRTTGPRETEESRRRRRSSCTDADRVNGVTTASTHNSALDHTTIV